MLIFLTGASGFLGNAILRELVRSGHRVTCLVRRGSRAKIDALNLPEVNIVEGEFTRPQEWLTQLPGHDVVINSVGIIRETASSTFEAVHTKAPIALFDAAVQAGVKKIIQISALGADDAAESRYHLSKRAADQHLSGQSVSYVILRPSFVYGPHDHSMTFFLSLAALPVTFVPGDGTYQVQPVFLDDLVRAVSLSVEQSEIQNVTVDVGGHEALSFNTLLDTLAQTLGKRQARKVHVPWAIMRVGATVTDRLGHGPITGEELGMLRRGNTCDNGPFVQQFGFEPVGFAAGIARKSLSQADRWYARLTHLRVPLRLSVAFIWLITGWLSAFVSVEQGFDLLRQVGITGMLANVALFGTAFLEIGLGLATAFGWRVRLMGAIQILLMVGFTGILTWGLPELWQHPFGPLTKNVPLLGATLVMMALAE